jgi:GAF domain-containing protein
MRDRDLPIAEAMQAAARALEAEGSVTETLDGIVQAALQAIPGVTAAGISQIYRRGRIETLAASGDPAREVDQVQYQLREGPCVELLDSDDQVMQIDDLRDESRWPNFAPKAEQLGVRSWMAYRLYTSQDSMGALNLFSTEPGVFDEHTQEVAGLLAAHAAIALGAARHKEQLEQALVTRKTIGQGLGIVMERYNMTEMRALQFLIRVSRDSNIKLREVAAELVAQRERDATTGL